MVMPDVQPDGRRSARHAATRDEIVTHAIDIMNTQGVVGLTLGELARRIGVRTPSLYTYFDSKNAVYDELFRRGWQAALDTLRAAAATCGPVADDTDLVDRVVALTRASIAWHLDHPGLAQLMMSRPVPDYEPSPEAYAPSVELAELLYDEARQWHDHGLVRADADPVEVAEVVATASAGMIGRQTSNEPGVPYDQGRHTPHWPALITAVIRSYLP